MKTGNNLWWENVVDFQDGKDIHYKEAELEVFKTLYERMKNDGMTQIDILEDFRSRFGIGYSAFYNRLNKLGKKGILV